MPRTRRRTALCLLLATVLAATGAPGQVLGPEFQVNEWTTDLQFGSAVAADAAGEFVVAWQSYRQGMDDCSVSYPGSGCFGVFARRIDRYGNPIGGEFQVNVATGRTQKSPAVARTATGEFVVAWDTDDYYFDPGFIKVRRFDAQGVPLSGDLVVSTHFGPDQRDPDVATNDGGDFVVAWEQTDIPLGEKAIYARRFDGSGTPQGPDFAVQAPATAYSHDTRVAVAESGEFIVVWERNDQIRAQRYDENGGPQGIEMTISQAGYARYPALALQGAGGFVVAWQRSSNYENEIFARRFDAAGTPLGDEFPVTATPTTDETHPALAVDGNGDFLVAWWAFDDGSGNGVFARRFEAAGTPSSESFLVNATTALDQNLGAIAATPGGDFLVVWDGNGQDGSSFGVFGRMVRFPFFADGFESRDTSRWSSTVG